MSNRNLEQLITEKLAVEQQILNYRIMAVLRELALHAPSDLGVKLERNVLEEELAKPVRNYNRIRNVICELEILLKMDGLEE